MIYTVTLNPSIDYIIKVPHFKDGIINHTDTELMRPGGKGINVSSILHSLGYETTALGFIAGHIGNVINEMVKGKGITTDFVAKGSGESRINVKMRSDTETEINGMGPHILDEDMHKLYGKLDDIKDGDVLVLSGSVPAHLSKTTYADILQYVGHKDVLCVVDAEGELLTDTLSFHPFLIKPNQHELSAIFHHEIKTKEEAAYYGHQLQKKGARNVLISMGKDGAVLVSEDARDLYMPAPKGKVINSVGAGDSMVAGFLYGWLESHDYNKALTMGIASGSATAFQEDLANRKEIYDLLHQITVE